MFMRVLKHTGTSLIRMPNYNKSGLSGIFAHNNNYRKPYLEASAIPYNFNYKSDFPKIKAEKRDEVADLFAHINKNKAIPDFLAELSTDHIKVKKLLAAITQGKARAHIFQDENCYLYLLYLIKTKQIKFWEGMSVYGYLLALIQFSGGKDFYKPAIINRARKPLVVVKLVRNGNLTSEGYHYLQRVRQRLANYEISVSLDELISHVLALNPTEQWSFKISDMHLLYDNMYEWDLLAKLLTRDMPFLPYEDKNNQREFWVPSFSLMNYFIKLVAPLDYVQMMPTFGLITDQTNIDYLKHNVHPVALYAKAVKHNLLLAGNRACGVFFIWLHDIGHTFWASLLTRRERHLVLHDYIALFAEIRTRAQQENDKAVVEIMDGLINKAADFELVPPESFHSAHSRFDIFTSYLFGNNQRFRGRGRSLYGNLFEGYENHIGDLGADRILYILLTIFNEKTISEAKKQLINILLFHIYQRDLKKVRDLEKVATITTLANGFTTRKVTPRSISWDKWYEMLHDISMAPLELEVFWSAITEDKNLEKEFMILVNDYNIRMFPYYLKPTPSSLSSLKKLLAEKVNKPIVDDKTNVVHVVKPSSELPASAFFSRRSLMPVLLNEFSGFIKGNWMQVEDLVKLAKLITKIENYKPSLTDALRHRELLTHAYIALAEASDMRMHFSSIEMECYQKASKLNPDREDIRSQLLSSHLENGVTEDEVILHTFARRSP